MPIDFNIFKFYPITQPYVSPFKSSIYNVYIKNIYKYVIYTYILYMHVYAYIFTYIHGKVHIFK